MKVLITGASGQVGRALIEAAPAGVSVLARSHAELDITDADAVRGALEQARPEVIINTAAYTAVDRAESEPELARLANADGPRNLAAAARQTDARLLHLSTDFVFDGSASLPYSPEAPTHPLGVYGRTKRDGEQAVLEHCAENAVIVRTAWVYAAQGSNFVRTMLRLMGTRGAVRVVADQIGTPTAARSLATALWQIVAQPQLRGVHHFTDAGVASWYDLAVAVAEESVAVGLLENEPTVTAISTADYPTPARRPPFSVLDKSSLAAVGICPQHWRKALRGVIREIQGG
jgi:dTDP-4-dehydrorhamnose reductase